MMKFNSIDEWKDYCFNTNKDYLKNQYFKCWIKKKQIDIFNYTKLDEEHINEIKKAVENAFTLCNLGFKIKLANRRLKELHFALDYGSLNGAKILEIAKESRIRDKKCSANIFLVNVKAKSGREILKFGDALTYVSDGIIIFTFNPLVRYTKKFFRSVIAHEVYHLLGLNIHHNESYVEGYGKLAKCVMEHNAPSEQLCRKCKDGLISFLEGIDHAIKQ